MSRYFFLPLTLSAAFSIQGCSTSTEKHTADSQKGPQPSAEVALKAYESRSLVYPADFPLPRYPDAEIEVASGGSGKTRTVILKTKDDVSSVFNFYAAELKKDDWDIGTAKKNKGYVLLHATKQGTEASVMVAETRGEFTAISLYCKKK